jgi:hypothetical protein
MIISASYKTDIPAFYGDWFINRLDAGRCRMVNPYGGQVHDVDLRPGAVDGFVFWTRNPGPFQGALAEVRRRGLPFVVQMTVTGYPRPLDAATIDGAAAVALMADLARAYGPAAVVWRYDPIVASDMTPPDWHASTFARLARALRGVVDECVVSFVHVYRKTRRNLDAAARVQGFDWRDPDDDEKRSLLAGLAATAADHGITLALCGQPHLLVDGVAEARCIDARRLATVAGRPLAAAARAHRKSCRCDASRDIGDYDSCPHGCVYCYAVEGRGRAKSRFADHDPDGELLIPQARE